MLERGVDCGWWFGEEKEDMMRESNTSRAGVCVTDAKENGTKIRCGAASIPKGTADGRLEGGAPELGGEVDVGLGRQGGAVGSIATVERGIGGRWGVPNSSVCSSASEWGFGDCARS